MVRIIFLLIALCLLALGALTVVRSPDWAPWRLAVLAGEFGHWLAVAALGLTTWALIARGEQPVLAFVTAGIALGAAILLLKPTMQAWQLAARLPHELAQRFGPQAPRAWAFSLGALFFPRTVQPVSPQTLHVTAELPLDFYRAVRAPDTGLAPCVVLVHGGGWDSGDRLQLPQFNHWLARRGYAVAAVSYRLAPKHRWPAQREDVQAAIAFLKSHAAALGIDPTRLVLMGRSAGAQIAAAVAYTDPDPAVRGLIDLYGPVDLHFGYEFAREDDVLKSPALMRQFLGGTPQSAKSNYDSASAYLHVSRRTPPTLMVHGVNDPLVWHRHSVRLETRLAEQGVPGVFVSLPWATHAFDFNLRGPGGQLTTFAVEWFLASVTK